MGCWNETCAVTNLPIRAGDRVAAIILRENHENFGVYPDSQWAPIGFPLFGEYNDYGDLENAATHPWNQKFFYLENDKSDGKNSLERTDMSGKLMFIHEEIYRQLVDAVGRRVPIGQTRTYRECLRDDLLQKLNGHSASFCLHKPFQTGQRADARMNEYFCDRYHESRDESEKAQAVETQLDCQLFYAALLLLRKGYRTISGTGSQSLETALHILVARFTIEFGQKILMGQDDGEFLPDGNEEPLLFFP